jgi:hypothetical protein
VDTPALGGIPFALSQPRPKTSPETQEGGQEGGSGPPKKTPLLAEKMPFPVSCPAMEILQ